MPQSHILQKLGLTCFALASLHIMAYSVVGSGGESEPDSAAPLNDTAVETPPAIAPVAAQPLAGIAISQPFVLDTRDKSTTAKKAGAVWVLE